MESEESRDIRFFMSRRINDRMAKLKWLNNKYSTRTGKKNVKLKLKFKLYLRI